MAKMPIGQPRSVPDPAGELYDQKMAQLRAERKVEEEGFPLIESGKRALQEFQNGPKIPRPSAMQTLIPVVGPAWEALGDLQDGDYGGAALNAATALVDVAPAGVVVKGGRALSKGIGMLNKGSKTADSSRKVLRQVGFAKPGEEIHHTIPLNGLSRNTPDYRNHYMFLKSIPKEQHRRLTGSWAGKGRYDPVRRVLYGTTDWMKAAPAYAVGHGFTAGEHLTDPEQK